MYAICIIVLLLTEFTGYTPIFNLYKNFISPMTTNLISFA